MRDPKRIDAVLAKFGELWRKYPDQRFGQITLNMLNEYCVRNHRDPFFPEDDEFMKFMDDLIEKW